MVESAYDCPLSDVEGLIEVVYAGPGWMAEGQNTYLSVILRVIDSLQADRIGDKTQFVKIWFGKLASEDPESVDETGRTKSQQFKDRIFRHMGGTVPDDAWCVSGFQEDKKGDGPFVTWCKSFQGNTFYGQIKYRKSDSGFESNFVHRADLIDSDVHKRFLKKMEAKGNEPIPFS